jgi:hypothetical protein
MPHARSSSIESSTTGCQPSLNRQLRRWLAGELPGLLAAVDQSAARQGTDRYRKHFPTRAHFCLLLFHGLSGSPSLTQSYATFSQCPLLLADSGLATDDSTDQLGVSFSQLAASNTSRAAVFLATLLPALIQRVQQLGSVRDLPPDLRVLDGTFLPLSLQLAPWITPTQRRVPLQVLSAPAQDLPEHLLISMSHLNDYVAMDRAILQAPDQLAALEGQTLTFDLGYYSHDRFRQLLAAGVHLVTRLHPTASFAVEADLPIQSPLPGLPAGQITVLSDQRITLGSPTNRRCHPLPQMRLVRATVAPRRPRRPSRRQRGKRSRYRKPQVYAVLTDRWDLSAREVIQLYLWRWTIEQFFLWLKRRLQLIRLLGYSRNAVTLSIWLATLIHLLCLLAAAALGRLRCSVALLTQLPWVLAHLLPADAPI